MSRLESNSVIDDDASFMLFGQLNNNNNILWSTVNTCECGLGLPFPGFNNIYLSFSYLIIIENTDR